MTMFNSSKWLVLYHGFGCDGSACQQLVFIAGQEECIDHTAARSLPTLKECCDGFGILSFAELQIVINANQICSSWITWLLYA